MLAAEREASLSVEELLVARHAGQKGSITVEIGARFIQRPAATAATVLQRLTELGLLEARGNDWVWKAERN